MRKLPNLCNSAPVGDPSGSDAGKMTDDGRLQAKGGHVDQQNMNFAYGSGCTIPLASGTQAAQTVGKSGGHLPPDDLPPAADLAWGARECAVEMYGADTPKNRKRVFNWRADVREGLHKNPNYPNPGFVFFRRRNAVVLCRRTWRALIASLRGDDPTRGRRAPRST
jgi:hypothetical protein